MEIQLCTLALSRGPSLLRYWNETPNNRQVHSVRTASCFNIAAAEGLGCPLAAPSSIAAAFHGRCLNSYLLRFPLKIKICLTYCNLFQWSHISGTPASLFCPLSRVISLQGFVLSPSHLTGFTALSTQHAVISLILVTQACLVIRMYIFKWLKLSPGTRDSRHIVLSMNPCVLEKSLQGLSSQGWLRTWGLLLPSHPNMQEGPPTKILWIL